MFKISDKILNLEKNEDLLITPASFLKIQTYYRYAEICYSSFPITHSIKWDQLIRECILYYAVCFQL